MSFVDRRTRLGGPLPVELGRMTNLESLTISSHQIGGPLPEELGNLENLESMYLAYNNLSGPIPPEIGDLVNLTSLYLRRQQPERADPAGDRRLGQPEESPAQRQQLEWRYT